MRSHISGGNGNCEAQDKTALISCFGDTISIDEENVSITNTALIRRYDLQDQQQQSDHDYIANCCPCIV